MKTYDLIIAGGGASGMLCAIEAKNNNINNVLVIEKNPVLGGSLCLAEYNISKDKNITGKEYLSRLREEYDSLNIETYINTLVLNINDENKVVCVSPERGIEKLYAQSIILANGGKEKGRNALALPGDRCTGIFTVGNAKSIINVDKAVPGKDAVIYGCENLHMIAHDLKEHNINIKAVICDTPTPEAYELTDKIYNNFKLTAIHGSDRVKSVTISDGKETNEINCDTVILALGMLSDGLVSLRSGIKLNSATTGPEVDSNFETSRKHIFACGNGIYIHSSIEEIQSEPKNIIKHITSL